MRTTLTLDDDLAAKLKDFARRKRLSFKDAVNSILRRGLTAQEMTRRAAKPFRVHTFRSPLALDPARTWIPVFAGMTVVHSASGSAEILQ